MLRAHTDEVELWLFYEEDTGSIQVTTSKAEAHEFVFHSLVARTQLGWPKTVTMQMRSMLGRFLRIDAVDEWMMQWQIGGPHAEGDCEILINWYADVEASFRAAETRTIITSTTEFMSGGGGRAQHVETAAAKVEANDGMDLFAANDVDTTAKQTKSETIKIVPSECTFIKSGKYDELDNKMVKL